MVKLKEAQMHSTLEKPFSFIEFENIGFWNARTYLYELSFPKDWIPLKGVLKQRKDSIVIEDTGFYKRCRVRINGKGILLRDEVLGSIIKTKKQYPCKPKNFLVAEIDAKVGGFGIVPNFLDGAIVSSHYFLFEINESKLLPEFLELVVKCKGFLDQVKANGSTNYAAIRPAHVLEYRIPLPSIETQKKRVDDYNSKVDRAIALEKEANELEQSIDKYLMDELGILDSGTNTKQLSVLHFVNFNTMLQWGTNKNISVQSLESNKFKVHVLSDRTCKVIDIFRGKSPKYDSDSNKKILNQKCVRWNFLDLKHAKKVNEEWIGKIQPQFFTKLGDILINSTGEGTIGRCTEINRNEWVNLLPDSHILLLRLDQKTINPSFFASVFNSILGQDQVGKIKSAQSTNQTELGINNLKKINVPLPPITTQVEIANHVELTKEKICSNTSNALTLKTSALSEFKKGVFLT